MSQLQESSNQEKLIERIDAVFLPVSNLEKSIEWYTRVLEFGLRWKNERFAGLTVGDNVGFHIRTVENFKPIDGYSPFNFGVRDIEKTHRRLKGKGIAVSEIAWDRNPVQFEFVDPDGNPLHCIQL